MNNAIYYLTVKTYFTISKRIKSNCPPPPKKKKITNMQLLKNYTVKQHKNLLSGTWRDSEQESGGVCRTQFDLIFLWFYFKYVCMAMYIAFVIILVCNFKNIYIKATRKSPQWYLGRCRTRIWWNLLNIIWFYLCMIFLNFYSNANSICHDFGLQL